MKAELAKLKAENAALAKSNADTLNDLKAKDGLLSKAKADSDALMKQKDEALAKAKAEFDTQLSAKEQQHKLALTAHEHATKAKGFIECVLCLFIILN